MATTNTQKQEGTGSGSGTVKRKPVFVKVNELKPGTKGHNLTVKVVSSTTVLDKKSLRNSGNTRIAECLIGDDTASILFTARNDQGLPLSLSDYGFLDLYFHFWSIIIAGFDLLVFRIWVAMNVGFWGFSTNLDYIQFLGKFYYLFIFLKSFWIANLEFKYYLNPELSVYILQKTQKI